MPEQRKDPENTLDYYYRTYYHNLRRFAISILKNPSEAEEAVQDTFTIAYRNSSDCLGSENPIGWLFSTLKNVMLHAMRERTKMNRFFVALDDAPELRTEMESICELDPKSSKDLELLNRIYVEGYSITETALEMGVTPDTLNSRIYRIKKRLRQNPKLRALWEEM